MNGKRFQRFIFEMCLKIAGGARPSTGAAALKLRGRLEKSGTAIQAALVRPRTARAPDFEKHAIGECSISLERDFRVVLR